MYVPTCKIILIIAHHNTVKLCKYVCWQQRLCRVQLLYIFYIPAARAPQPTIIIMIMIMPILLQFMSAFVHFPRRMLVMSYIYCIIQPIHYDDLCASICCFRIASHCNIVNDSFYVSHRAPPMFSHHNNYIRLGWEQTTTSLRFLD